MTYCTMQCENWYCGLPLKNLCCLHISMGRLPFLRLHDQVRIVFTFFPYSTWHKALPKVLRHVLGMINKCLATSCCCQSWCSLKMGYQKCTSRRCCHQKLCHIFFDWQHLWWIHWLYKWQLIKVRCYFSNIDLFLKRYTMSLNLTYMQLQKHWKYLSSKEAQK